MPVYNRQPSITTQDAALIGQSLGQAMFNFTPQGQAAYQFQKQQAQQQMRDQLYNQYSQIIDPAQRELFLDKNARLFGQAGVNIPPGSQSVLGEMPVAAPRQVPSSLMTPEQVAASRSFYPVNPAIQRQVPRSIDLPAQYQQVPENIQKMFSVPSSARYADLKSLGIDIDKAAVKPVDVNYVATLMAMTGKYTPEEISGMVEKLSTVNQSISGSGTKGADFMKAMQEKGRFIDPARQAEVLQKFSESDVPDYTLFKDLPPGTATTELINKAFTQREAFMNRNNQARIAREQSKTVFIAKAVELLSTKKMGKEEKDLLMQTIAALQKGGEINVDWVDKYPLMKQLLGPYIGGLLKKPGIVGSKAPGKPGIKKSVTLDDGTEFIIGE